MQSNSVDDGEEEDLELRAPMAGLMHPAAAVQARESGPLLLEQSALPDSHLL